MKLTLMSRLRSAVYGERSDLSNKVNRFNESVDEYSLNGSIKHLVRRGKKNDGEYGKIDNIYNTTKNMNTKFLILHTIAILAFSSATAQTTLSSQANAPRNGDNIEREVMAVPAHVAAGSNCVWDFSMLEATGERHETIYMADSADCLTSIDERCIRRNVVSPTGVYVCIDETPLYKFEYDNQPQESGNKYKSITKNQHLS